MIIEVKRLIARGEYDGGFSFDMPVPADKLVLPLAEAEGDIHVTGRYVIYDDDSVDVNLTIFYRLKGQCSYCLEPAETEVNFSYDAVFVPEKDDSDNYYYDGTRIDLKACVNDAFVFSQPEVLLCKACASSTENTQN